MHFNRPALLMAIILFPLTGFAQALSGFAQEGESASPFNPRDTRYLWPTEASPYLSSTFGETRSAHFHSALDIKTWGRRGYRVFATRDGVLHRIAIGPKGYGKVIYLKHEDGSYSVYAHLLSFNREIQQLADSIRFHEDFRFEIDRFVESHNIRVRQGDLIGRSGASGIGPPHLHFELRTPNHRPFNPLLTNLDVEDRIAPKIRAVSLEPLSRHSRIEGQNRIYTRRGWFRDNRYRMGTVAVEGPVGLGVDVFDQSDHVSNVYAAYELSMELDGKEMFRARADSFAYQETGQMHIDRVYPLLKDTGRGYQRLYIADGNTLPFYSENGRSAVLDLQPGTHNITVRATDFSGNTSRATLTLNVSAESPNTTGRPGEEQPSDLPKALSPHNWDWYDNWFTVSETVFQQLTIAADSGRFVRHRGQVSIDLRESEDLFVKSGDRDFIFRRISPGSFHYLGAPGSAHFAVFPEATFHDTLSVGMSVRQFSADSAEVEMYPEIHPLRNSYSFHLERDSVFTDTTKLSFYRKKQGNGKWSLVPTRFTDRFVIAGPESLGTFVTLRDTTSPSVTAPRLSRRPDGKWLVSVRTADNLSGIDYSRTIFEVNGVRGIAEYEPEAGRTAYYHPDFTPSGEMEISVTVYDKMNNRSEKSFLLESGEGRAR